MFKGFKGKMTTHWLEAYEVDTIYDSDSVKIEAIDVYQASLVVNGH